MLETDELKKEIMSLDSEDIEIVMKFCQTLLNAAEHKTTLLGKLTEREIKSDSVLLIDLIKKKLDLRISIFNLSPSLKKKLSELAQWLNNELHEQADRENVKITTNLKLKWYQLFVDVMYIHLSNIPDVPVGIQTIVNNGTEFLEILETQLPGYRRVGWLLKIIT